MTHETGIKSNSSEPIIAILTFSHTENMNYGAILQSFASYQTLKNLGYNPSIIKWRFKRTLYFDDIKDIKNPVKLIEKYFRRIFGFYMFRYIKKIACRIGESPFIEFSQKYLSQRTELVCKSNIKKLNDDFDVFIVGSDQVWRYKITPDIGAFCFDFVNDEKKKISYAASFGVDSWNEADDVTTTKVKFLLKRFDAVSVREKSGVEICKTIFGINAEWVLDPTFLLPVETYYQIIDTYKSNEVFEKRRFIAHMKFEKSSEDDLRTIEETLKMDIIDISGGKKKVLGIEFTIYNPISKWLALIKEADFVITDSFHCAVFSIMFGKDFAVIVHSVRGKARLDSLLGIFDLSNRIFANDKKFIESKIWEKRIDFSLVSEVINKEKDKSLTFLKKSILK